MSNKTANNEALVESLKRKLKITWDEDISEMIEEGKSFIISKCGELDFENDDRQVIKNLSIRLLKEYCRFEWNDSSAYFETSYASEILNLQLINAQERMGRHAKKN